MFWLHEISMPAINTATIRINNNLFIDKLIVCLILITLYRIKIVFLLKQHSTINLRHIAAEVAIR